MKLMSIRIEYAQQRAWILKAKRSGMSLSAWIRKVLDKESGYEEALQDVQSNEVPSTTLHDVQTTSKPAPVLCSLCRRQKGWQPSFVPDPDCKKCKEAREWKDDS